MKTSKLLPPPDFSCTHSEDGLVQSSQFPDRLYRSFSGGWGEERLTSPPSSSKMTPHTHSLVQWWMQYRILPRGGMTVSLVAVETQAG